MVSFINLMADDVWSEIDIKSRLHAEIRSEISEFAETELNRALQGKFMGMHTLTAAEGASLARFAAATARVEVLGKTSRADMALLATVFVLEAAQRRLLTPVVEPALNPGNPDGQPTSESEISNQSDIDADLAGRTKAQAAVDASTLEAKALAALRSPKVDAPAPVVLTPVAEEVAP